MEHAEHAAHAGHSQTPTNRYIGVTMAMIGALIAYCAAMVGSQRNELTKTLIEQTQAHADYTAASTKFRSVMLELEKQQGRLAVAGSTSGSSGGGSIDMKVVTRFLQLADDYLDERKATKKWSESYDPLVETHFEAAEGFEHAQLLAEFGIVLASLAVLLGSRPVWMGSVVLAVCCIVQLARVSVHTRHVVRQNIGQVHEAEEAYNEVRKHHAGKNEDEATILQLKTSIHRVAQERTGSNGGKGDKAEPAKTGQPQVSEPVPNK